MKDKAHREGFTFWRSFRDAIAAMPEESQLPIYRAIADFALDGIQPADLSQFGKVVWTAILPTLELGRSRAKAGASGGKRNKGNPRPWEVGNTKAKPKHRDRDYNRDGDRDGDPSRRLRA